MLLMCCQGTSFVWHRDLMLCVCVCVCVCMYVSLVSNCQFCGPQDTFSDFSSKKQVRGLLDTISRLKYQLPKD